MTITLENPPTQTAAAYARGATKVYGSGDTEVTALDNVDVEFVAGNFTAIMGPSGSGKSTLMHCMAGLDRLTDGSVFVGDTDVAAVSEKDSGSADSCAGEYDCPSPLLIASVAMVAAVWATPGIRRML